MVMVALLILFSSSALCLISYSSTQQKYLKSRAARKLVHSRLGQLVGKGARVGSSICFSISISICRLYNFFATRPGYVNLELNEDYLRPEMLETLTMFPLLTLRWGIASWLNLSALFRLI